jgi:formiminoglutamase
VIFLLLKIKYMSIYQSTPSSLWSGREADTVQYWHQAVTCLSTLEVPVQSSGKKLALLGYAGDEGVRRNQGRTGAALGPDQIRKLMGSMAFHLPESLKVYDLGNILTEGNAMEGSHELLHHTIKDLLSKKVFPIILGGGHDLAFPHGRAVLEHCISKDEKLGIINLDAHFDLRPKVAGQGHSGSPFYQLEEMFPRDFHYLCLGIQKAANPGELFEKANACNTQWMEMDDFTLDNWEQIASLLDNFSQKVNKIYLSIDLDGFSSAYAPGVSAPSPWGFSPELIAKVLQWIAQSGKLISTDIVELNPEFDKDGSTSKLAARCIEYTIRNLYPF